jgi:hypothetical protein
MHRRVFPRNGLRPSVNAGGPLIRNVDRNAVERFYHQMPSETETTCGKLVSDG